MINMSPRARLYITFAGTRAVLTAVVLIYLGHDHSDMLYQYAIDPVPWLAWVFLWSVIGVGLLVAAWFGSHLYSTIGLGAIASVTAAWAAALTVSAIITPSLVTISLLLWWVLVAKDFIQLRQPLSSPFEDLLKTYEEE
jgi:hypothetical protein